MVKKAAKKAESPKPTTPETKKKIKKPKKESKSPAKKELKKISKKEKQEKAKPTAESESKKLPKKEKTKKKASETNGGVYNEEQTEKFKAFKQELQKRNNADLKEMLKKNDQTISGTKEELIEKIADGKTLGRIPRCPHCCGGKLKFDLKTGVYNCPGYRDDMDYHKCTKKYQLKDITRELWID